MLEIKQIVVQYFPTYAIHKLSLTIDKGELIGLFGNNGSGKTSLLRAIAGVIPIKEGEILLDGEEITYKNMEKIAYGGVSHKLPDVLTTNELFKFYQMQYPKFNTERFRELQEHFKLQGRKKVKKMSNGEQIQLDTALTLSRGADYILLDEPFVGSDYFIKEEFYRLLLRLLTPNETVIFSTHLIDDVKTFLSRAFILDAGKLVADYKEQDLEEGALIEYLNKS
jgi:ABC-2 type transport system ATP-binding protein